MCKTRWSVRDVSYEHFYLALPFIAEALEVINSTHPQLNTFKMDYTDGWSSDCKKEATSYLKALSEFEFITEIVSLYRLLHPLAEITQKLQGRTIDVVAAYTQVESCILDMEHIRGSIEDEYEQIFKQSERLAAKIGLEPSIPRTVAIQRYRNNVPADCPQTYYLRALVIPLLDTFIIEMKFRFNPFAMRASMMLLLVPSILCGQEYSDKLDISQLLEEYGSHLPNPDILDQEISLWRHQWIKHNSKEGQSSLAAAIKKCDEAKFPNLFILLKIGCTLPLTLAECERSFSAMRRLRTWLRASMTMERLSALAIMHIHRDRSVDYSEAVKLFMELHPRKIELKNLVYK